MMSIRVPLTVAVALAAAFAAPLSAVEPDLRLGPAELVGGVELQSQFVEHGAVRVDDTTAHSYVRGRFFNVGLEVQSWLAVGDDDRRNMDHAEIPEVRLRLDYLWEMEGLFQILPHYQTSYYPAYGSRIAEPHWIGVDGWYLLPWEGMEVGGSFDFDAADDHGWWGSVAGRELVQAAPLDFLFWQALNFGDSEFHRNYLTGVDTSGLTTFELGARVTLPLPWDYTWFTGNAAAFWWLDEDNRDALRDDAEFVISFGAEARM
jgi:hypothetical protein